MDSSLLELRFEVSRQNLEKILIFISKLKNISWFKKKNNWEITVLDHKKATLESYREKLKQIYKIDSKIHKIQANWINHNQKNEKIINTQFFQISQGLNNHLKKKKYKLTIPAANSFGTGQHESTILAVLAIEKLIKKKKFLFLF